MYAPFWPERPKPHANRIREQPKNPFVLRSPTFTPPLSAYLSKHCTKLNMPLPNADDIDDLLNNNSSNNEEDKMAADIAAASVFHAQQAGVIPPPPPGDGTLPYYLLGQQTQSQTQDTLIPTQLPDFTKRHRILLQLSMTQGSRDQTEFDKLGKPLRQQFPTQTQGTQSTHNKKKETKPKAKIPKAVIKGRSSGARGYTEDKRMNFLEILERRLPISGSEWSLVASEHSETYGSMERNVDSI